MSLSFVKDTETNPEVFFYSYKNVQYKYKNKRYGDDTLGSKDPEVF